MIRLVTTKAWKTLQEKLESEGARAKFLEEQGGKIADKARAMADTLGKVASWLTANLIASGRSQRVLTARDVAKAVGFDLAVEPGKDGQITLRIVPKAPAGKPVEENRVATADQPTLPAQEPKP